MRKPCLNIGSLLFTETGMLPLALPRSKYLELEIIFY